MRRFRLWLFNKFLPAWAKETVYRENKDLREEVARLKVEIGRLNAYIDGLEDGIRAQRRVTVHNEVTK